MIFILLFAIGIVLTTLLYIYLNSHFQYWKNRNIPSPKVSFLFGNLKDVFFLKKNLGQTYDEIYKAYSELPYVGFYKLLQPSILVRDPKLIKEVLVQNFNNFHDNDFYADEKVDPIFAKNPFASTGNQWKVGRNQSTPSFTVKRMKEMYPLMNGVGKNLVQFINNNVVGCSNGVNIKQLCLKFTIDMVACCALGLDANSFTNPNSEYIKMVNKTLSPSFASTIKMLLVVNFQSLAALFKIQMIPSEVAEYYTNLIVKSLEYRRKNNIQRGDFLDSMNELQQQLTSDIFTYIDITAHISSFFLDGTETSAIAMSFALYELALHPDILTELQKEVEHIKQKHNGSLDYDAIQEMKYLDQVVNESLRKNSPIMYSTRICTETITFESLQEGGERVSIEPGTLIAIPFHSIHNDAKYYPNPERYDPSRFSKDSIEERPKYTFLPFGEGPRICIGQRFGIGQTKVGIIHIIENFDIRIDRSTTVPYELNPRYFLLDSKSEIRLNFYKRHQ